METDGKVKWFSEQKGYGFVVDGSGTDHYFHVTDVRGADLPRTGTMVRFQPQAGKRGPQARQVTLLASDGAAASTRAPSGGRADDRVVCGGCDRRMIPRIITGPPLVRPTYGWTPVPKRSICPFCGVTFQVFPASTGQKIALVVFISVFVAIALVVLATVIGH